MKTISLIVILTGVFLSDVFPQEENEDLRKTSKRIVAAELSNNLVALYGFLPQAIRAQLSLEKFVQLEAWALRRINSEYTPFLSSITRGNPSIGQVLLKNSEGQVIAMTLVKENDSWVILLFPGSRVERITATHLQKRILRDMGEPDSTKEPVQTVR